MLYVAPPQSGVFYYLKQKLSTTQRCSIIYDRLLVFNQRRPHIYTYVHSHHRWPKSKSALIRDISYDASSGHPPVTAKHTCLVRFQGWWRTDRPATSVVDTLCAWSKNTQSRMPIINADAIRLSIIYDLRFDFMNSGIGNVLAECLMALGYKWGPQRATPWRI